jgi:hypothetical protein
MLTLMTHSVLHSQLNIRMVSRRPDPPFQGLGKLGPYLSAFEQEEPT